MLLIRYSDGRVLTGALIALGDQKIRVALKGAEDTVEYRLISRRWVSEDCELVSIGYSGQSGSEAGEQIPDGMMPAGPQSAVARLVM